MKNSFKILMAAALVLVTVSASAQFGIKVGYVNSKFVAKGNGVTIKTNALNGVKVGFDYDIAVAPFGLSVRPGLNYTFITGEMVDEADVTTSLHYLNVPIDLKYAYNFNDDFGLFAVAGPKFVIGVAGKEDSLDLYKDDGMNRFDIQLGLGAGVRYKRVSLELGYDWGMLNLVDTGDDSTFKRDQFNLTLGLAF